MHIYKLILLALLGGAVAFSSCKKDDKPKPKNQTEQPENKDEEGDLTADGKVRLSAMTGNYEGTDVVTKFETGIKAEPKPFSFSITKKGEKSVDLKSKIGANDEVFTYVEKKNADKIVELECTKILDRRTIVWKMTFTLDGKKIEIHENTTALDPKTKKEKTVETSLVKATKK